MLFQLWILLALFCSWFGTSSPSTSSLANQPSSPSTSWLGVNDNDEPTLEKKDANPCEEYKHTVQEFESAIWVVHDNYSLCMRPNETRQTLRVHTELLSKNISEPAHPVVFVTRSDSRVQTWQLPFFHEDSKVLYNSSKHTICRTPQANNSSPVILYMDTFTSSEEDLEYSFKFEPVEQFILNLTNDVTFNLSFNNPQLYYFKFPDGTDTVRVVASSGISKKSNKCAIVSVQNATCPVNDQLDNARSKGMFQTMTASASLVVTANKVGYKDDFFIVIVAANEEVCKDRSEKSLFDIRRDDDATADDEDDSKPHEITLKVEELRSAKAMVFPIVLPVLIFLALGVVSLLFFCFPCTLCTFIPFKRKDCFMRCIWKKYDSSMTQQHTTVANFSEDGTLLEVTEEDDVNESSAIANSNTAYGATNVQIPNELSGTERRPDSSFFVGDIFRSLLSVKESELFITQLTKRGYTDLERSYKVYGWNTVTVGIFYALPAFQLVFSQQMILNENGDQDLCYYNFKCSHPFDALSAFNNVWSNIGYFIMGLSFLGIVSIRHHRANKERQANKQEFDSHGVPQFFGVYYAMGFALVMEGFMSSFYHICPSDNNFQFDTAFMFIIGGLLVVKMLQARHPDIQANAFIAFFCFAVVTFLTFIGIWEWSKGYWETKFTLGIIALIGIVMFATSYYFFHGWTIGNILKLETYKSLKDWFISWCVLCNSKENTKRFLPKHRYRFFKVTLLVVLNFITGLVMALKGTGIATIVLALFIINFLVLLLLYIICKLRYREPWTLMPAVFLVLLSACWLSSFWFYTHAVSQWENSPANSRRLNKECIVLKFYDNHDIWHFLSAAAMFFSFLFLFTLDDGTKYMKRSKLHVF